MRTVPRLLFSLVFVVLTLRLHGQAPRTFKVWVLSRGNERALQERDKLGKSATSFGVDRSQAAYTFEAFDLVKEIGQTCDRSAP